MLIRKAAGEEMLKLWGCEDADAAPPTAKFFYRNITSGNAVFWTVEHEGALIGELYVFFDLKDTGANKLNCVFSGSIFCFHGFF